MTTMLAKVLKHTPHCSMVETFFWGLMFFSDLESRSKKVGSASPNRVGSRSRNSMNSPFHILSAIFLGTGGEYGPTSIASVDGAGMVGATEVNGVRGVTAVAGPSSEVAIVADPIVERPRTASVLGKSPKELGPLTSSSPLPMVTTKS